MLFGLDDRAFQRQLSVLSTRDIRLAASWALNDAAKEAFGEPKRLEKIAAHIESVFDRPTNHAKNAFMQRGARANALEVTISEKNTQSGQHFLKVQQSGGGRSQIGAEKRLVMASSLGVFAVIPADGARLDAHGNWSRGERIQAMSALQVQRDVGVTSNQTAVSKARGKRRGRDSYFVPKHGLTPGIYKRNSKGDIGIVAIFTPKVPQYKPRLDLFNTLEREFFTRLPAHLSRTIAKMVTKRATGG